MKDREIIVIVEQCRGGWNWNLRHADGTDLFRDAPTGGRWSSHLTEVDIRMMCEYLFPSCPIEVKPTTPGGASDE